jgi:hypothetical protein
MRGRRLSALITAGLIAIALGGCGGGDEIAPEVPGPPADVVLPEGTVAAAPAEDEDAATTDEDAAADETATPDGTTEETAPPADETGGTTTPETTEGGTAAPEAAPDSPDNDTAPPAGSEAEQFEDFCAQNPGAC